MTEIPGKMAHRKSIAWRLTLSMTASVVLVASLALTINYYLAVKKAEKELTQQSISYLGHLMKSLELPLWHFDNQTVQTIGAAFAAEDVVVLLQIADDSNKQVFQIEKPFQGDPVYQASNILHDGTYVGTVRLALTTEYHQAANERLLWSSMVIILLVVITLLLGTRAILTIFLKKPMANMGAIANAYASNTALQFEKFDVYEEFKGLVAAMKDMGNRIRQQMTDLQTAQDKYQQLFEMESDALFLIREDNGNIIEVNRSAEILYGYSRAELLQMRNVDLSAEPEATKSATKTRLTSIAIRYHQKKDGTIFPVEITANHFNWKDHPVHIAAIRDISERIQRENELQASEEKFRKMVEFAPYPLLLVNKTEGITYINQKLTETFGYELPEISGIGGWWERAFPDSEYREKAKEELIKSYKEAATEKKMFHYNEWIVACKDGERKNVEFSMVPIGDMELWILIDQTRRIRMQEMMIQTEKMISVGGLAAGMAHEINNPLSAVLQGAQNISRRFSPTMEKNRVVAKKYDLDLEKMQAYMEERKIPMYLQGIRESGSRAAQIIMNMLKFSRKSESRRIPVEIDAVLENTIDLASNDYDLARKFDFKHIRLEREFDPDLKIITCTETELEQVLLNLLKNAAQSLKTAEQTEPPRITLRTIRDGDIAQIEIEDNGPGMDEKTRKRIFEPFFTTKPVGQGTGLGLSVSYSIITNNHKGTMEVQSAPGRGTRFIIRIPIHAEETA